MPGGPTGIVGIGLIGGSLALALRRAHPGARLVGVDCGPAIDRAKALGALDEVGPDLSLLAGAELVVLAAPVRQNTELLRELSAVLAGPVLITDTGSTKRAVLEAARALPPQISFVGGHPLAGAARAGATAARADLFEGRRWLITPSAATRRPEDVERVAAMAETVGATPQTIDAVVHDRLTAFLSHLPQLTASALMEVVGGGVGAEGLALAGPGLADTTRLASSPTGIWRDICETNADAIAPALDALIETLQRLRGDLTQGDAVEEVFASARRWRGILESR